MSITFTRVTWYSQVIAIILFVAVFILGMYLGMVKTAAREVPITSQIYACPSEHQIAATYFSDHVSVILSDGRSFILPQVRSASGARYATSDESFVFWNKGNTAFTEERGVITYKDCVGK